MTRTLIVRIGLQSQDGDRKTFEKMTASIKTNHIGDVSAKL